MGNLPDLTPINTVLMICPFVTQLWYRCALLLRGVVGYLLVLHSELELSFGATLRRTEVQVEFKRNRVTE